MKTIGLTLEETLRALVDGKAKKAEHPAAATHLILDPSRKWFQWECKGIGFTFTPSHLTPEWVLIDPVQEYREVPVELWLVASSDGDPIKCLKTRHEADCYIKQCAPISGAHALKMTGIDRVPKKEKVVRRVEVKAMIDGAGYVETSFNNFEEFVGFPETHGKTGKLIFEWEE